MGSQSYVLLEFMGKWQCSNMLSCWKFPYLLCFDGRLFLEMHFLIWFGFLAASRFLVRLCEIILWALLENAEGKICGNVRNQYF